MKFATLVPFFLSAFFFLTVAEVAFAQPFTQYPNPIKILDAFGQPITDIPSFLLLLVDLVFLIATPIIVIFIIYAGFLFVSAKDNEAQLTKAKTVLLWTLIGAAVLLGAKVIAAAIQATVLQLK